VQHIHIRIHRWVIWWLSLGVVFGAVALLNILLRDLTRTQDKVILTVGIVHWVLGGLVCWAFDGIRVGTAPPRVNHESTHVEPETEWHSASDFVLPGSRKSILPPRY
jgi:hypothetical protein